ncbi:FlgD immunoglobulin-like domain containing protein [bacterium]
MFTTIKQSLILIMIFVLGFTLSTDSYAQKGMHKGRHGLHGNRAPYWDDLSEVQKEELEALIQTMRDQDADRKTIHEAVHSKLDEWSIDVPESPRVIERLSDQLTEAQKSELQNLFDELRVQDATHSEIREAIHNKLDLWGIERPERPHIHGRLGEQLTDDQKTEIDNLVETLKEQNATRSEIRQAVHDKLESWGITRNKRGKRSGRQENRFMNQTDRPKIRGVACPNPFNPETSITYELQESANVSITLFNTQGQIIRTLTNAYQQAGQYQIQWDGKSESGENVPTGTYVYKIQADDQSFSGRMLMMK